MLIEKVETKREITGKQKGGKSLGFSLGGSVNQKGGNEARNNRKKKQNI